VSDNVRMSATAAPAVVGAADATLDDVLDRALGDHPAPSAIADELITEARAELQAQPVDVNRAQSFPPGFNPHVHAWPPDKTARGTWRKLKRGAENPPAVVAGAAPPAAGDVDSAGDVDAQTPEAAADAMAALGFGVAAALLGPDWTPAADERSQIVDALTRYYRATGAIDLPPGVALAVAVGAYAVPRALLPSTRERMASLVSKITGKRSAPRTTPADVDQAAQQLDDAGSSTPRRAVGLVIGGAPRSTPADVDQGRAHAA
jgi:hypothetical protein